MLTGNHGNAVISIRTLTAITIMQPLWALPRNPGIIAGRVFIDRYRVPERVTLIFARSRLRANEEKKKIERYRLNDPIVIQLMRQMPKYFSREITPCELR